MLKYVTESIFTSRNQHLVKFSLQYRVSHDVRHIYLIEIKHIVLFKIMAQCQ